MSVLFLDDMETRHKEFERRIRQRYDAKTYDILVHQVWTAEQAIERLESCTFVQVFLDHDLCESDIMVELGQATEVTTGMAVVDYICQMDSPPNEVVIHSCNGPAAIEMERRLREAHGDKPWMVIRRVPFPYLIQLMDVTK